MEWNYGKEKKRNEGNGKEKKYKKVDSNSGDEIEHDKREGTLCMENKGMELKGLT